MKALAATLFFVCLGCTAAGQKAPKLDPATAIDIRVESVQWHPRGGELLYTRAEEGGIGIGLYRTDDQEGKVLLHLGKDDVWESQWLEGTWDTVVIVYKKVRVQDADQKQALVYLLDGKAKSAYEVFTRYVPADQRLDIDVDTSPSLLHAVFRVKDAQGTHHFVLPNNGGKLVASTDIDQAVAQGQTGPAWSLDGTALYGQGLGTGTFQIVFGDAKTTADTAAVTLNVQVERLISKQSSLVLDMARMRPAIQPGTPVLEVVPANGVLRQVRYRGSWEDKPLREASYRPESHLTTLEFGRSRGGSNSLWLLIGQKENQLGVMVAAHADKAVLAPEGKAIAYITDGALFVRKVKND